MSQYGNRPPTSRGGLAWRTMQSSRAPFQTLAGLLSQGRPDQPALIIPEGPAVTYAGLEAQVESLAGVLRHAGVEQGSVVSIVLGNDLPYIASFLAVARAGAVAAPLNPAYTVDEFRFFMGDAGANLAILAPGTHPTRDAAGALGIPCVEASLDRQGRVVLARDGRPLAADSAPSPPAPDEIALFLHTSGTTSRPKGVPLTHGNLAASIGNIASTYQLTADDVALAVMPLFHVHGLIGVVLSTLATGGTVVAPSRFSASAFWPLARAHGATWYSAVPTIHQILISRAEEDRAPVGAFRFIRSCSAALSPALHQQLEARFGAPVLEAYGMTEASHQMASNPPPPEPRKVGTVGKGTGIQVAIMDERGNLLPPGQPGEVVIRGPSVTPGYKDNPAANAATFTNGWFRTGDQGIIDTDGYLRLTGRLKELINRGGEKISPIEVDNMLLQHPAIAEAVSFGVPDAKYGEEIHAAVVLKGPATEREIQEFCQRHLAAFKAPKAVHFLERLPRTATGKVQRRNVAALFSK